MPRFVFFLLFCFVSTFGFAQDDASKNETKRWVKPVRDYSVPEVRAKAVERSRSLIYYLRNYTLRGEFDKWIGAMKELSEIGEPAVKEIINEIYRYPDKTKRSLLFCLRSCNDKRAIPAFIHALKFAQVGYSDMSVSAMDPDLNKYLRENMIGPKEDGEKSRLGYHVREIIFSLEKLTGHNIEHRPEVGVHIRSDEYVQRLARKRIEYAQQWGEWWGGNKEKFFSKEQLVEINSWSQTSEIDEVEIAGLKTFGMVFPHGGNVKLGPVKKVSLYVGDNTSEGNMKKEYYDFETEKIFIPDEEMYKKYLSGKKNSFLPLRKWEKQNGLDLLGGSSSSRNNKSIPWLYNRGCIVWNLKDSQWDSLEKLVKSDEAPEVGKTRHTFQVWLNEPETKTFLFKTRENNSGVIQFLDSSADSTKVNFQYRMFEVGK